MQKVLTYDELKLDSEIWNKYHVVELNNFFELLCDVIDDDENWYIDTRSPVIKIIKNLNESNENFQYLLFKKDLTFDVIMSNISLYFHTYILKYTEYDIQIGRITIEDISLQLKKSIEYQGYQNNIIDYSKKIWWNSENKTIENVK
jgi:hypothetical protein